MLPVVQPDVDTRGPCGVPLCFVGRYATSKNTRTFLDVASSEQWLGYTAQDNAEAFFQAKGMH
jgi:hypothetical protein